jgi:MFS family permease
LNFIGATGGFAVLRHRDFTLFLSARFFSSIAAQMIVIAVGWQVYHMTGRVLYLGLIGLSQFLPFLCLVLIAGHVADQFDRRLIILFCNLAYLICGLLLLAFAFSKIRTTLPIFAVLACLGVARAFQTPAAQSLMPNLIPVTALGNALALNSSTWQVATIAGPSVGGIMYAVAEKSIGQGSGAALVYAAAAVLLVTAVILMALIRMRRVRPERKAVSFSTLVEGLRFVWQRKIVLGAISLDLFAVLFGGATALLPAFTQDVLHAGPEVFGLLRAAPGIGAGVTGLVLAFRPITRRVGVCMFAGVAIFGTATVGFGLTHRFWVAMTALVLLGAGDMLSVFIRSMLVQSETPDEIRGRVSAVNSVFVGASNELGEFESGFAAAWIGLVPAIVAGGIATLVVTVVWARWLFPSLWRMQSFGQMEGAGANGTRPS